MKTFLIFGVNGMAGHMIAQYLTEQGHTVYGFARQEGSISKRHRSRMARLFLTRSNIIMFRSESKNKRGS